MLEISWEARSVEVEVPFEKSSERAEESVCRERRVEGEDVMGCGCDCEAVVVVGRDGEGSEGSC